MAGGRKYKPSQIRYALECILAGFSNKEAIALFRNRFGNQDWGMAQLKYMRVTYGDHPDFGCCLVNQTKMAEQEKAALRARLVAEARQGPEAVHSDDVTEWTTPKNSADQSVVNHQAQDPSSSFQTMAPLTPYQNGAVFTDP
ncbi:hypothetical protein E8E14_009199 [Neopestalotiopsis sp. 37M]|nr:hypothetical protein E8E14_009199 [Neopestalotiopsis sp. 37M]